MARILKTLQAELDLDEIWLFIATDNVGAADALIDAVSQTACRLAEQRLMGRARPELAPEIRSFQISCYVLFSARCQTALRLSGRFTAPVTWRRWLEKRVLLIEPDQAVADALAKAGQSDPT